MCLNPTSKSYNVTIRNLVFDQCNFDLFYQFGIDTAVGLVLHECCYCKVEDVYFLGYGFAAINLLLHSYLNNITIDTTMVSIQKCGARFFLLFADREYRHNHDSISINKLVFIGIYSELCYGNHKVMEILLYQSYFDVNIELCNSQFYNANQAALYILMYNSSSSILIKKCTFMYHRHIMEDRNGLIYGKISPNNVTIQFENCAFYNNTASILLQMDFVNYGDLCVHPSNVTIKNCDFIENVGVLLMLSNHTDDCTTNIFFENVNFAKNKAIFMMFFYHMSVYMNGMTTILENIVERHIIEANICYVTISKTVTFLSNICSVFIYLISNQFMLITEYTNIMFINNTIHYQVIVSEVTTSNNYVFPYCIFQYMESTNYKYDVSELIRLYIITFSGKN